MIYAVRKREKRKIEKKTVENGTESDKFGHGERRTSSHGRRL